MEYIISDQLANKILNYMSEKPYKEVYMLISELQKIRPNTTEENKEDSKPINE